MITFVLLIHILVCFGLIAIVLLQSGKGAELGAAFGGSSQTLFGSRGAATFLSKMTTVIAVVFMLSSLSLAVLTIKGGSVVEKAPAQEETTLPPVTGPNAKGPIQPSEQKSQAQPTQQPQPQQQQKQQAPHIPPKK
jgi:preprotein translocase subunit SecG